MTAGHDAGPKSGIPAPPIPHEHGAWVMLFAPALCAWLACGVWPGVPAWLFLLLVFAAFMGRNAAALALRGRGGGVTAWALVFGAVVAASTTTLVVRYECRDLLYVGALTALLFGAHSVLLTRPGKRRLDRSLWGEVLAVAALTLTGPAACVVAGRSLDGWALALWLGTTLFFSSGVFTVKAMLNAAKTKGEFTSEARRTAARDSVAYHVLLTAAALGGAAAVGGASGALLALAFLPAIARAFHRAATMGRRLPDLKMVGIAETVLALWFAGLFAWSLRAAA